MKNIKKRIAIAVVLAVSVVPLGGHVFAAVDTASSGSVIDAGVSAGEVSSKEEVVYAKLAADGTAEEAYIVNILSIAKAGVVVDYGDYSSVKNLTTDAPIAQKTGGLVTADAMKGDFYYQGNIEKPELPWHITIQYELNGKTVSPESLAGATGKLAIRIETRRNTTLDPGWYENLMMQLSVTLDAALCKNIYVEDGMIANAGGNKLVTFTVMPGKDGDLWLEADVVDFSMPGISFSAIPLNLGFERPDTNEMTEDMNKLTDGIGELDDAIAELNDGAKKLADGTADYANWMNTFSDGLGELAQNAKKLKKGADDVGKGLEGLAQGLGAIGDASDILPDEIANNAGPALAQGLGSSIAQGMSPALAQGIGPSIAQGLAPTLGLDAEMLSQALTPALVQALEPALAPALTQALEPALAEGLKPPLRAALTEGPSEQNTYGSYGYQIKEAAKGAEALSDGFNDTNPKTGFTGGLNAYLDGVKQASSGAGGLSGGAGDLRNGLSEFSDGIRELKDGTLELRTETADMPAKIEEKIDEMIGEYDKSDYVPISFASTKNGRIGAIQFVISSDKIEKPDEPLEADTSEAKTSIIDRFFDLFRK